MKLLKSILTAVFLILATSAAQAQEVIYSSYEKFDLRSGDFAVIGKVGGRLYTYRATSDGFFLDAWNDSMARIATVLLDFFPKKIHETKFIAYPEKMMVLYQSVEGTKVVQYAALLDERGRLLKGPMQLSSAKTGIFGASRDYYSSAVSDDKRWVLVYGFEGRGEELNGTAIWLNDSLRVTDRGMASFHGADDLSYGDGVLTNDGTFYVPAYALGSRSFADQAWMLSLPRGGRKFNATELPLAEAYVNGLFVKHDNANNRIYLCGFYSDKRSGNNEGLLYARYDVANATWQNTRFLPFDGLLRNATGERSAKRALNDYVIRQLIIRKDGGFALLAEDYYVTARNNAPGWGGYYSFYNGPFATQTVREYHYEDVLGLSYNEKGERDWYAFVRKSQYSQEDGGVFSSYALLNTGGALGMMFNDFNNNKSRIGLATIDGSGKVDMRYLAAGGNEDPDWLPRSGKQIAAREIVVPCLHRRQLCFAKIVF